ncbi:MAG: DUF4160 domain-containing protein [Spirochaetales bacterium]|nr:DUF4160 domain-containing protein [Spirochaetales bacterium]
MPVVSEFFGIRVAMFYDDHLPAHFHAVYGEHEVIVDIAGAHIIKGIFPVNKLKLVLAWCELHREELIQNWDRARQHGPLLGIEPLR